MKKILAVIGCIALGLGAGWLVFEDETTEIEEVIAMMESDMTNHEKVVYLEGRYNNEIGRLEILLSHADLCSPKYLNELSTLSLSFNSTKEGYKLIDLTSYKNLNNKYLDYLKLVDNFDEMYRHIDREEYEDALVNLEEIERLLKVLYPNIESEIATVR